MGVEDVKVGKTYIPTKLLNELPCSTPTCTITEISSSTYKAKWSDGFTWTYSKTDLENLFNDFGLVLQPSIEPEELWE